MAVLARENPFRAQRLDAIRYRVAGGIERVLERLDELGRRAAIVGPEGHGKTTLIEELARALKSRGFRVALERLSANERALHRERTKRLLSEARAGSFLLLDGADELPPIAWRRFVRGTRRAAGLVVTSRRPGRLPTLLECRTSPELLEELIEELLDLPRGRGVAARLAAGLYAKHSGNLRAALRELYDLWANGTPPTLDLGD